MSFEIVTDSTCNLPEDIVDEYGLHILSLRFLIDEEEFYGYKKGETVDLAPFYQMMREKKEIKTSLINVDYCLELCSKLLKEGKDILYIGFSSALSGSYQAVAMALEDLKEEYPDRKIYYVDSLSAALGEGLLIYHTVKCRREGMSIEQTYQWVEENRFHLCHWFTVDDLFFLHRGGRVSRTSATLGSVLNIKPVLHMDDEGRLILVGKVRGRKKSLDELVDHMEKTAIDPENQTVFISHGDCLEDAQYVADRVKERLNVKDVMIRILDPVIGAHSGPGTVALFFLGENR